MFNLDNVTNENNKEQNKKWPYIPDHPSRILIIGGCWSGKTNALLNLVSQLDNNDEVYWYANDLSEPKYEFLIKTRTDAGIKHLNDLKHLLSVQILWMMFMEILMITAQGEKENL